MNINEKREPHMKIAISSDHGGNNLRKEIMALLDELSISYEDLVLKQMILSIIPIMHDQLLSV